MAEQMPSSTWLGKGWGTLTPERGAEQQLSQAVEETALSLASLSSVVFETPCLVQATLGLLTISPTLGPGVSAGRDNLPPEALPVPLADMSRTPWLP